MARAGQRKRDNRGRRLEKVVPLLRIGNRVRQAEELPLENAPGEDKMCSRAFIRPGTEVSIGQRQMPTHEYTTGTEIRESEKAHALGGIAQSALGSPIGFGMLVAGTPWILVISSRLEIRAVSSFSHWS